MRASASRPSLRGYSRRPPLPKTPKEPLPPRFVPDHELLERVANLPSRQHMDRPAPRTDLAQALVNLKHAVVRRAKAEHSAAFDTTREQLAVAMGYEPGQRADKAIQNYFALLEEAGVAMMRGVTDSDGRYRRSAVRLLDPDCADVAQLAKAPRVRVQRRSESRSEAVEHRRRPWCRKSGRGALVSLFSLDVSSDPKSPPPQGPKGPRRQEGVLHVRAGRRAPNGHGNGLVTAPNPQQAPPQPVCTASERQGSERAGSGAVVQGPWRPSSELGPIGNDGAHLLVVLEDPATANPFPFEHRNGHGQPCGFERTELTVPGVLAAWFPFMRLDGQTAEQSLALFDQAGGEAAGPAAAVVGQLQTWARQWPDGQWSVG